METYQHILSAAAHCFGEIGVEKTSITAIAERANVSRGLVAHYFPKKSELFLKVVQNIASEGYRFIEAQDMPDHPKDRIIWMFEQNLAFFTTYEHFAKCFVLFYYYAGFDQRYRALNVELNRKAVGRLQAFLSEYFFLENLSGLDEELSDFAEYFHSMLVGEVIKEHTSRDKETVSHKRFLNACRKVLENLVFLSRHKGLENNAIPPEGSHRSRHL